MGAKKAFTLVELLIVIVIIGILASAMMLSSGSATASAEATNIISDLRSMKAASLMLYADSMDAFNAGQLTTVNVDYLKRYMDNPSKFSFGGSTNPYRFTIDTGTNKWWVGYNFVDAKKPPEVKEKIAGKSQSIGLYKNTSSYDSSNIFTGATAENEIWMVAR